MSDIQPGKTSNPSKVLVVEDVVLIRMTIVDMVEDLGHAAVEAGDGPQALEILRQDPSIAILLTDLGLPGMPGRELVVKARELRPDLKVVVASGYPSELAAADAAFKGVRYLAKPFDLERLRVAISEA
mgnify:CR=1 FL=1